MKIGIIGAGAIGGWIGVKLAAAGHNLSVLARGATLQVLRQGPWTLRSQAGDLAARVAASDDPAALGVQDMLVITLKGPALPAAAPMLAPMIGPETIIVPAMNGVPWWFLLGGAGDLPPTRLRSVDPDGAIAAALPFGQVLGSVVHTSVAQAAPGVAQHIAGNGLIIGEPSGRQSDRLACAAAAFAQAGIDLTASPDIRRDIWYKLWGNMTMNPISALTGATCDRILDDPLTNDFVLAVMEEARTIGARIGCPIHERGEDRSAVTRKLGAFKTSMLQDVEAGRAMEIDQLVGAPYEIGRALGMSTPNIAALLGLTRLFGQGRGLYGAGLKP